MFEEIRELSIFVLALRDRESRFKHRQDHRCQIFQVL